jgi:uncharacterized protein
VGKVQHGNLVSFVCGFETPLAGRWNLRQEIQGNLEKALTSASLGCNDQKTHYMRPSTLLGKLTAGLVTAVLLGAINLSAATIKTAIIQGQSNGSHNMVAVGEETKKILESTDLFKVDIITTPARGQDLSGFKPNFTEYQLIVMNYDGAAWPTETQDAFVKYMTNGGGMVVVHSADNAFARWKEFNEMIAVGGWNGRNAQSGPYLRFRDGKWVPMEMAGPGGSHGRQRPYVVTTREPTHPIMEGLPKAWLHVSDELYDQMRGPAKNVTVLASGTADRNAGGSGEEEPILMAITYGQGRIFHTTMGHAVAQLKCIGFTVTLQRGAEWAATGKVTQKVPTEFPTETETKSRQ